MCARPSWVGSVNLKSSQYLTTAVKAFQYLYNTTIYTFSWTVLPLESLSHNQVHVYIILTVLRLGGL